MSGSIHNGISGSTGDAEWHAKASEFEKRKEELAAQQWALVREHVGTNTKELTKIKHDIKEIQETNKTMSQDVARFRHELQDKIDKAVEDLRQSITEGDKAIRAELLQEETRRTDGDRDLGSKLERLDKSIQVQITKMQHEFQELRPAIDHDFEQMQKNHKQVKDGLDALKSGHEAHKNQTAAEKATHEGALEETHHRLNARLGDEKNARELVHGKLQEIIDARAAEERQEREARIAALLKELKLDRTKNDDRHGVISDKVDNMEERNKTEAKELSSAERRARESLEAKFAEEGQKREARQAALQEQIHAERVKREEQVVQLNHKVDALDEKTQVEANNIKDLIGSERRQLATLDAHLQEERQERQTREKIVAEQLGAERIKREDLGATHHEKLFAHEEKVQVEINNLRDALGNERRTRDGHILSFQEQLERERAWREAHAREVQDQNIAAQQRVEGALVTIREEHHMNLTTRAAHIEGALAKTTEALSHANNHISDLQRNNQDSVSRHERHEAHLEKEKDARNAHVRDTQEQLDELHKKELTAREAHANAVRDHLDKYREGHREQLERQREEQIGLHDSCMNRINEVSEEGDASRRSLQMNIEMNKETIKSEVTELRELITTSLHARVGPARVSRIGRIDEHSQHSGPQTPYNELSPPSR